MYPPAWSAETIHAIPADRNNLLPGMERVAAVQERRTVAPRDAGVQQQSSATPTPVRTAPLLTNCGTVTYLEAASDSAKARRLPWCRAGRTTHHLASLRQIRSTRTDRKETLNHAHRGRNKTQCSTRDSSPHRRPDPG